MPVISKVRFTNVVYEGGAKRYNDSTFTFDGHNGAIVLENGGGKTVFIQTAIQAVLPHHEVAGRKVKDTLSLENGPAHVAIEWLLAEKPKRRYALTCVSLFMSSTGLDSLRYVYEYSENDEHRLTKLPFTKDMGGGKQRVTDKGEIQEYYQSMQQRYPLTARTFDTLSLYYKHLEEHFHIIHSEWEAIVKINSNEGGIEEFFNECRTSSQLVDRLLIPTIEDAMEGFQQGGFADLFQTQREGFKQYKELKEKLEENRRILAELKRYVAGYERLDQEQQQYEALRQEAKAHLQVAEGVEREQESERVRLVQQLEAWTISNRTWRQKNSSLHIASESQKAAALETELEELGADKERLGGQTAAAARYYHSLEYAEQREKLREAESRIAGLQQEIARLSRSQDEAELQEAWQRSGRKLRAWFIREEGRLTELLQEVRERLSALDEQVREAVWDRGAATADREQVLLQIRENETKQTSLAGQQAEIARKILNQLSSQTVEQQLPLWAQELQQLDELGLEQAKALKEVDRRRSALEQERSDFSREQLVLSQGMAGLQAWQEQYAREHGRVRAALAELQPTWERLSSVHEKMDSIRDKLADGLERRRRLKQQLLHKERLAYRYVDDYEEQVEFFADPLAARLVSQWSNQFTLLETGIQYARAVSEDGSDRPLWALTLVTTSKEKPLLLRKLEETSDQLQYPIRVLSTQEAKGRAEEHILASCGDIGERNGPPALFAADTAANWVEPAHWHGLEDVDRFNEWRAELLREALAASERRQEKERELEAWQDAEKRTERFFQEYPLVLVHEQEAKAAELRERQQRMEARLSELEQELRQLESRKNELVEAQQLLSRRQQHLDYQLEQGHQYLQLGEKLTRIAEQLQPLRESLQKVELRLERGHQRLDTLERDRRQQEAQRIDLEGKLLRLQEDELYREVLEGDLGEPADVSKAAETVGAPQPKRQADEPKESIVQLRAERKTLEMERHRILKERTELERELSHHRKNAEDASTLMRRLADAHSLDTELELPLHVERQLKSALTEWRTLEEQLRRIGDAWDRLDRDLTKQEAVVRIQKDHYAAEFGDGEQPIVFLDALGHVRQQLAAERRELDDQRSELDRLSGAVERSLADTRKVLQLWNSYIRVHGLDDPMLVPMMVSAEEQRELAYRLEAGTQGVLRRLEQQAASVKEEQRRVAVSRQRFREFCQRNVQDVKLREMAERGVEAKESYAGLQEFEAMMSGSILKANQICELRMQTEDQKLQQFIIRIQDHLRMISQELRELPKRTRVRTESGSKEIYSFQVPDWEEQEGKERIRSHIEWIISQLEHPKYRDADGTEQSAAIRRDLEKWLDAKQLLQKVFSQGAAIRISCRKVSNDQQVTGAAYSWEESNRWSGGEKWSKNMTLFLGILNYVAEKRQHIHSHMKRHRAVILDNPFGKASSDHVLSPVFYIAEQLGFQMIALTAHVEGKFLQDYFPVVYSCRLRTAAGGSGKQIVDPQQQIHQAYFRDHAPEAMDRIGGEMKQMELF